MVTSSGRFGRKFDIVVGRILAPVSCPVYHCRVRVYRCWFRLSFVCFPFSHLPVTSHEDFPRTYVAGMLGHSLVHKNRSSSYQKFTTVKARARQFLDVIPKFLGINLCPSLRRNRYSVPKGNIWKDTKTTKEESCEWCQKLCRLRLCPEGRTYTGVK